jgi:transcriptional regulator with XRE-family HTH domain
MAEKLGTLLLKGRAAKGWTLRDAERETGLSNVYLMKLEKGEAERPSPNVLWVLAGKYDLDFAKLLRAAGLTEPDEGPAFNAAFRAWGDLSPRQRREALEYMDRLRRSRGSNG